VRKEFAQHIETIARRDPNVIFLTGDLGFLALESLRSAMGDRFINSGVSEQNMVSMAASLAYEGLTPLCYSIAPFAVFRPAEQIRVDVCLHNLNVKLVGNGGGFGYGIMGATHHAIEDLAFLSSLQNMRCVVPFCNEDVRGAIDAMMEYKGPSYLRLGFGPKPEGTELPAFLPVRKLASGDRATIVGIGPVLLNVFEALKRGGDIACDVFAVSELPLATLSPELTESVQKTGKLLTIEEHVRRGGLGEHLAAFLLESAAHCKSTHLSVAGYPNGLYGNQAYHLEVNNLSPDAILSEIKKLTYE